MNENIEIGRRIATARKKAGLNKKELAEKIQVHPSTIGHYEDGTISKIKVPMISSIALALHVNPMWILGKSEFINESDMVNDFSLMSSPLLSASEKSLIKNFRSLNAEGQKAAAKIVKSFTTDPDYAAKPETETHAPGETEEESMQSA